MATKTTFTSSLEPRYVYDPDNKVSPLTIFTLILLFLLFAFHTGIGALMWLRAHISRIHRTTLTDGNRFDSERGLAPAPLRLQAKEGPVNNGCTCGAAHQSEKRVEDQEKPIASQSRSRAHSQSRRIAQGNNSGNGNGMGRSSNNNNSTTRGGHGIPQLVPNPVQPDTITTQTLPSKPSQQVKVNVKAVPTDMSPPSSASHSLSSTMVSGSDSESEDIHDNKF